MDNVNPSDFASDVNERSRTYHFTSGVTRTFKDIIRIEPHSFEDTAHTLYTGDGREIAITGQYDALEIDER